MKRLSSILGMSLLAGCSAISTGLPDDSYKLTVNRDARLRIGGASPIEVREGEETVIARKPALVEAPGYLPTLVVPLEKTSEAVQVTLISAPEAPALAMTAPPPIVEIRSESKADANMILSEVLPAVASAQRDMASGKASAALVRVDILLAKYPQLSFLRMARASALTVLGKKAEAIAETEAVLRDFPDNESGREFYRRLAGKEFALGRRTPSNERRKRR